MKMNFDPHLLSRRDFLRQAACAALGATASANMIRDLRIMNSAALLSFPADYKALVCIFLSGGNDSNNLIIPTLPAEYDNYAAIRGGILALPRSSLLTLDGPSYAPLNSDGHEYGLHPGCAGLRTLFGEGKLALLFNAGTLMQPITATQYKNKSVATPPQLFSHSDQVTQWQTSILDQPALTGWGGRCADILNATQPDAKISLSVTMAGANTFEVGNIVSQFALSSSGAISLTGVTGPRLQAMKDVLGLSYPNLQEQAYSTVVAHSIETSDLLNAAIAPTASTPWSTPFPTSSLGQQLLMVARVIAAREALGMKRQIFFCSVGGYDTHAGQTSALDVTTGSHANLLGELSASFFAFQRALEQIGTTFPAEDATLPAKVTSFTASDFGRTFPTNGSGSDHGWGSHHLIMGGAVQGRRTYGTFPALTVNGPDDTSTGRWIPRISVDQYSATLAKWFGVSPAEIPVVFPNVDRFSTSDLGFMG
jgi:uncharacterized protein (DUF1501 family)